jgi:hypothetical protein
VSGIEDRVPGIGGKQEILPSLFLLLFFLPIPPLLLLKMGKSNIEGRRKPTRASGVLIDRLVGESRPAGYRTESRSHNAVVAAISQGRADWGLAIAPVARDAGLGFIPMQDECYDFVVPRSPLDRPPLQVFCQLLTNPDIRKGLVSMGITFS